MSEHLKCNILTFDWPKITPKFYITTQADSSYHRIHRYNWSTQIKEAFPEWVQSDEEFLYTTFEEKIPNSKTIKIDLLDRKELNLYRRFLNQQIVTHFINKGLIVANKFIGNTQIWVHSSKNKNPHYNFYYKFSLKIQFSKITAFPELLVSFDGTSKLLKTPIAQIEDTTILRKCVMGQDVFNYQKLLDDPQKEDLFNNIDFQNTYPVFNLEVAKLLDIPLENKSTENKYINYVSYISKFAEKFLFEDSFKKTIPINTEAFLDVPENKSNCIDPRMGMLEFGSDQNGNKKEHLVPKRAMNIYNPYKRPSEKPNISFLFIYHSSSSDTVEEFFKYLKNGVGKGDYLYFQGLEKYVNIKVNTLPDYLIKFENIHDPITDIKKEFEKINFNHDTTQYAAFYFSPFDKQTPDPKDKLIYNQVKEFFLNECIVTQVVEFEKLKKNITKRQTFQYTQQNMSLALHAKLGGIPWKLAVTQKKELVIGVGAYSPKDENKRYVASAFSFQNNGIFNNFEYFSKNRTDLLAGSICTAIRDFTSVANLDKVVIHFYKEMSYEERKPIIERMHKLRLPATLYILNINKTETKDIMAYDLNWGQRLMPKSGTYINIGQNEFLLFNNARYPDTEEKYPVTEGFPFPIKIKMSSPDKDAFEDSNIYLELLTQVYQFSRLYWKSLRQQNVPVTIKYPEMLAQIAPKFNESIRDEMKNKLWFL